MIQIASLRPSSNKLERLAIEAKEQGYAFVSRLANEAKSGKNNFNKTGEWSLGVYLEEVWVGCGGINVDPFTDQDVGRLQHVYVLNAYRKKNRPQIGETPSGPQQNHA